MISGRGKDIIIDYKGKTVVGLTEIQKKLFEGTGKTMKHIKVRSLETLDETKIVKLIKLVKKKCKPVHQ